MKKPRFKIGFTFNMRRVKHRPQRKIIDIYTTRNEAGEVVRIEYLLESIGPLNQTMHETAIDTTIARSLTNEELKKATL